MKRRFVMQCSILADSDREIVEHLKEIIVKIEEGQHKGIIPGGSIKGYPWFVDDYNELDEVDDFDYDAADEELAEKIEEFKNSSFYIGGLDENSNEDMNKEEK